MKVDDLIKYYAPNSTPGNPHDICQGYVTEIFPSEGLQIITDTQLIIDGLSPITYGRPIRLEGKGEWFVSDKCDCIVGHQDDGTMVNVHQASRNFKAISEMAKKHFMILSGCFLILEKRVAKRVLSILLKHLLKETRVIRISNQRYVSVLVLHNCSHPPPPLFIVYLFLTSMLITNDIKVVLHRKKLN